MSHRSDEEWEHLIAAAPEMLDALRELDRLITNTGLLIADDEAQAAWDRARSIIAKATGEAQ